MYYYEERDLFGKYRPKVSAAPPKTVSAEGRKSAIRRLRPIHESEEALSLDELREIYGTPAWVESCDFQLELVDRYPFTHYEAVIAYFKEEETFGFDETQTSCIVKGGYLLGVSYEDRGSDYYLPREQALKLFGVIAVYDLEESTIPFRNPPGGE